MKLLVNFTSKVYCTYVPGLCSDGDTQGTAVVKDVGATERASLVGFWRGDGVFEKTTFVKVERFSNNI